VQRSAKETLQPARGRRHLRKVNQPMKSKCVPEKLFPLTERCAGAYCPPDIALWGSSVQTPPPLRPEKAGHAF